MSSARDSVFSSNFAEVREFYAELRKILYQRSSHRFASFHATAISHKDCIVADSWSKVESRGRNDWFWTSEYPAYQKISNGLTSHLNKIIGLLVYPTEYLWRIKQD